MKPNQIKFDPETKILSRDSVFKDLKNGIGYQLFEAFEKYGDKICQIELSTNKKCTYHTIWKRSIRTALKLRKLGVTAGDKIVMCDDNNLNCLVTFCATIFIGAVPTFIPNYFAYDDFNALIVELKPKIIFTYDCTDSISRIVYTNQLASTLIALDDTNSIKFMDVEVDGEDAFRPVIVDDNSKTLLFALTSGSTGRVKCIELSQQCILENLFETYIKLPNAGPD